jgi:uroporphyrinogen-III decarboxylase
MGFITTEFFLQGSAEKLEAAKRHCLQVLPKPMVLSSGCDLPAKADPELVRLMMES